MHLAYHYSTTTAFLVCVLFTLPSLLTSSFVVIFILHTYCPMILIMLVCMVFAGPGCIGADRLSLTSKPRLYQLDHIKIDGKTVKVISRVAASWKAVATRLHFEGHEIRNISQDSQCTVDACREVFIQWLDGKGRMPTTWETIIKALEEADFSEVTNDLKKALEI